MTTTATLRARPGYRCFECGLTVPKWVGRCPRCRAWDGVRPVRSGGGPDGHRVAAVPIGEAPTGTGGTWRTGLDELDRVLGGGLVPGSVVLVAGEPGVGKSTLLLAAAARFVESGRRALVVTGEESTAQVRARADRIGAVADGMFLVPATELGDVLVQLDALRPDLVVVDSVQTIRDPASDGGTGGVTQVREVAMSLAAAARHRGCAVVLVGHVTKDGGIAGPRVLEHLVDVVLHFDGDRHQRLRMVRAVKNRFGPTDEIGCFALTEAGIASLPDPGGLFLGDRASAAPGTCVTVALEGRRPLPVEVQALVSTRPGQGQPRRITSGLDPARLAMVIAVLARHARVPVEDREVHAATVGGVRIREPAVDLALAVALASAIRERPVPRDLVAVGEVGLTGALRGPRDVERRLAEAARLGFRRAVVPMGATPGGGLTLRTVPDLAGALHATLAG